jgi:hypothetical protein
MVYHNRDYNIANDIVKMIGKASSGLGMSFRGDPTYIEIPDDQTLLNDGYTRDQIKGGGNYAECITADLQNNTGIKLVFVLISNESFHPKIKKRMDQIGVASQFMLFKNISKKMNALGVWSNILKQVNAKCGLDLYRINFSKSIRALSPMVVGLDVINMGANCVVGMTASYNASLSKYYTQVVPQDLHKGIQGEAMDSQLRIVCEERT